MAYTINPVITAENIRYYRELHNLTIRRLADLSLLSYHVIVEMEKGIETPSITKLAIVADVLGVDPNQLVLPRPTEMEYSEGC